MNEKIRILDSSALINNRGRIEGSFITVEEVIKELKDMQTKGMAQSMIFERRLELREPNKASLEDMRVFLKEKGMQDLLSDADVKVLALGIELRGIILTDDYDIQNCCKLLGLDFEQISRPGIKKTYSWVRKCIGCGKETDAEICEVCGSRTKTTR